LRFSKEQRSAFHSYLPVVRKCLQYRYATVYEKILSLNIENSQLLSPRHWGLFACDRTMGIGILFIGFEPKPIQKLTFPRMLQLLKSVLAGS